MSSAPAIFGSIVLDLSEDALKILVNIMLFEGASAILGIIVNVASSALTSFGSMVLLIVSLPKDAVPILVDKILCEGTLPILGTANPISSMVLSAPAIGSMVLRSPENAPVIMGN